MKREEVIRMAISDLKPFDTLTEEEQKKLASMGGKASVEAIRKKKNMKEALKLILELDCKDSKAKEVMKKMGIEDEDMNNEMALMATVYKKARIGDMQAVNFIRDTSGQKPVEVVETRETPKIVDDI